MVEQVGYEGILLSIQVGGKCLGLAGQGNTSPFYSISPRFRFGREYLPPDHRRPEQYFASAGGKKQPAAGKTPKFVEHCQGVYRLAAKIKRVDFTRKQKWISILIVLVVVYFAVVFYQQQQSLNRLSRRAADLESDLERLERGNALLRQQIELLTDDPVYIESFARRELGLVRDGETVYILPQRKDDD